MAPAGEPIFSSNFKNSQKSEPDTLTGVFLTASGTVCARCIRSTSRAGTAVSYWQDTGAVGYLVQQYVYRVYDILDQQSSSEVKRETHSQKAATADDLGTAVAAAATRWPAKAPLDGRPRPNTAAGLLRTKALTPPPPPPRPYRELVASTELIVEREAGIIPLHHYIVPGTTAVAKTNTK